MLIQTTSAKDPKDEWSVSLKDGDSHLEGNDSHPEVTKEKGPSSPLLGVKKDLYPAPLWGERDDQGSCAHKPQQPKLCSGASQLPYNAELTFWSEDIISVTSPDFLTLTSI